MHYLQQDPVVHQQSSQIKILNARKNLKRLDCWDKKYDSKQSNLRHYSLTSSPGFSESRMRQMAIANSSWDSCETFPLTISPQALLNQTKSKVLPFTCEWTFEWLNCWYDSRSCGDAKTSLTRNSLPSKGMSTRNLPGGTKGRSAPNSWSSASPSFLSGTYTVPCPLFCNPESLFTRLATLCTFASGISWPTNFPNCSLKAGEKTL